jgi:hypothetical protein
MPCSISQSLEFSLKIKRVLMYRKKMDCMQETSIKSKMMSTFKKREITRIMANVKPGKSCKSQFKKLHAKA